MGGVPGRGPEAEVGPSGPELGGPAGVHDGSGARQDREAQHQMVEAILAEAALANTTRKWLWPRR